MSRLLAALRRIEARTDTAGATVAVDAVVEPRMEDDPVGTIAFPPQESSGWPGDIVYDPQPEFPGQWVPDAVADWPAVTHEPETGYSDARPWPDHGFDAGKVDVEPEASIEGGRDIENIEEGGCDPVEDVLVRDSVLADAPSLAEPLQHVTAITDEFFETPSEESTALHPNHDKAVTEVTALAVEANLPVADQQASTPVVSNPSSIALESLPTNAESLKAGIGKYVASFPRMGDPNAVPHPSNDQTLATPPTSGDFADEPVVSVRLPGFGRPNRRGRVAGQTTAAEGSRRPALVPFLPPAQRPYREACESILSALPQGSSVALVLAWTDEDLDHSVLSARLAEVMADRLDDPVLLIDMGPKRRLSTLLQAPAIGSLTEAMVGFVSWRDQIVQTDTAGLCLLPSGPHDFEADPVAVARLIEACKEDFGIVLVLGGALSVIPENVLTACDAAVLLVEAGHTSAAKALGAIERLRRSGTDVAGCLLTATAEG